MAIVAAMLLGAVLAVVAVAQISVPLLVVAGLFMVAGIVGTVVLSFRRLERPQAKTAAIMGALTVGVAVLLPAGMNVDRCERLGSGADLSSCNLAGERLFGQDLSDADLSGADLTDADLGGADLTGANLAGADLTGASLTGAEMRGADLGDANLDHATANGADLSESDLTGAVVTGVDLTDSELTGAVLAGAELDGSDLTGAILTGADLGEATAAGATFTDVEAGGLDLSSADLSGAEMTGITLDGANLEGTVLAEARMANAILDGANLAGADLSSTELAGASAVGADFEGAVMTGTVLGPNDFYEVTGLTDEALSAALGVPVGGLPGATAQRGIHFDRMDDIVTALTAVRDGRTVPDARPYAASGDFHPAIVFDATADSSTPTLAGGVQAAWAPTGIRYAELVVVVQPQTWETIEVCSDYFYIDTGAPAPDVTRMVSSVVVRVLAANNGAVVAEQTFRGTDPRACQETESNLTIELRGDPPELSSQVQPWLNPIINPPADRTP